MEFPDVSIVFDGAQRRMKDEALFSVVFGGDLDHGWDDTYRSNMWVDPVTKTARLWYGPNDPLWLTSGTGIYQRYRKADYTLVDPGNWDEETVLHTSDYYLVNRNTNTTVRTPTLAANTGIYMSFFPFSTTTDDTKILEFGFGSGATHSDAIAIDLYASGRCELFRYGVLSGVYTLGDIAAGRSQANSRSLGQQYVGLWLIPGRFKELTVVSTRGGGFSHVCTDLDDLIPNGIITPNAPFWWRVPSGRAVVQAAKLQCKSPGFICGKRSYFRKAPIASVLLSKTVMADLNGGTATMTLRTPDNSAAFVPNGVNTQLLMRVDCVASSGGRSPEVYSATIAFDPTYVTTPSLEQFDATGYCTEMDLDVPETNTPATCKLTFLNPRQMESDGLDRPDYMTRRPIQLKSGGITWFDGRSSAPPYKEAATREADSFTIEIMNLLDVVGRYRFRDEVPLWGMSAVTGFKAIAHWSGIEDSRIKVSSTDAVFFGTNLSPCDGEFGERIEVGDTGEKLMTELHRDYIGLWFMSEVPTPTGVEIWIKPEAELMQDPDVILWPTKVQAYAYWLPKVGDDLAKQYASRYTYQTYGETLLEAETNDIWVSGQDPRTKQPIVVNFPDRASQDPTLLPSERGINHTGEINTYAYGSTALTSLALCVRTATLLEPRLMNRRDLGAVTTEMHFKANGTPVWKGDVIDLAYRGRYRVRALKGKIKWQKMGDRIQRSGEAMTYVLEYFATSTIADVASAGYGGTIDGGAETVGPALGIPRS